MIHAALLLLLAAAPRWEDAFPARGAPPPVHATVRLVDAGGKEHRLELWRRRDQVRRDTDGARSIYATRVGQEVRMVVVDLAARTSFSVTRTNLARIGTLTDFDGLARLISPPAGKSTLAVNRSDRRFLGIRCRMVALERQDGLKEEICWSAALALPLWVDALRDGRRTRVLEVLSQEPLRPEAASSLTPPNVGLVQLDADREISPD